MVLCFIALDNTTRFDGLTIDFSEGSTAQLYVYLSLSVVNLLSGVYMHFVMLREKREPSDPGNTSKLYSRATSWIKGKRIFFLIVLLFNNVVSPIGVIIVEI